MGDEEVNGRRLTRVRFGEQGRTLLRSPDGENVAASGEFWIDPDGAVWRAELSIVMDDDDPRSSTPLLDGQIGVEFQLLDDGSGLLVPATMTERYVLRSGEEDHATAEYSDFRRFRVETRQEVREP